MHHKNRELKKEVIMFLKVVLCSYYWLNILGNDFQYYFLKNPPDIH